MTRESVKVKRVPITYLSEHNIHCGGWYPYAPTEPAPKGIRVKENERLLYCPYCGKWSLFKRKPDDQAVFKCIGWCGWSNTEDYYVKKFNGLWKMDLKKSTNKTVPREVNMAPKMLVRKKKRK